MIKNEEKQNGIWKKISKTIKKGFDSKPAYNEKNLKTKTQYFEGKINTNFYRNKIPKEGFPMYLLIIINVFADWFILFLQQVKNIIITFS